MTVIIGSLFLPYTVQFEVGPQDREKSDSEPASDHSSVQNRSKRTSINGPRPIAIKQSSILPSLSIANSNQISPSSSPGRVNRTSVDTGAGSVEEFFLQEKHTTKSSQDLFAENLHDKLQPQYIQPRSTVNRKIESSVIEPKKKSDDIGLPSVKVSRSSTSLVGMNQHSPSPVQHGFQSILPHLNLHSTSPHNSSRFTPANRSNLSISLQNNSLTSLIDPIEEEETYFQVDSEDDDWGNDFNEITNPRAKIKLAPFGGFSNPKLEQGLISKSSVFETSPWSVLFAAKGNGSLIKAVKTAVDEGIIHNRKWVGTLAMPSDEVPQHVINDIASTLSRDYNSEAVVPSDLTFSGHYKSFCKQVLWPTLHYEIPDNPKSKAFEDHSWGHYKALNQLMADKIVEVYEKENAHLDPEDPENMIWIHDYHLLLVPQMVREKLPQAKIGLFLHVSFPSSEVFRCLAQRDALLKGMLGASSISFQTEEYVRHFLQTCSRLLLADTSDYGISYDGRFTMVNTIPVGIDAQSLHDTLYTENVQNWRSKIRERWGDQHLIVSRDKLDKLRGIKEKLLAYEKFLHKHPSYVANTVLIQLCIGTPSDEDYATEVMKIVTRINSMSDNISVTPPVVLLQQDISFDQYLALQMESDVFVVSSMREGLNLTCHEFIIATTEKKSPLLLSEFTGSSQLLGGEDGALLINPWDIKDFSEKFYTLLTMSPEEKVKRWTKCNDVVTHQDYKSWIKGCMMSIIEAWRLNHKRNTVNSSPFSLSVFEKFYYSANGQRLFLINLETASALTNLSDTLSGVPISTKTRDLKTSDIVSPTRLGTLLSDLLNDSNNKVYLCSYLKRLTLDSMYKRLPQLGLIAENGAYIKMVGSKKWISIVDELECHNWMPQVQQIVESKAERLVGSKSEVEDCTIIFNPGLSFYEDRHRSIDLMGDLIQHVNELFDEKEGIHASLIRNNVVIQQNQLGLRALTFLVNFYNNNSVHEFKPREINDSATSTPVKEKKSVFDDSQKGHLGCLFISGGTTAIDERNFNYANTLGEQHAVPHVLTVASVDSDCKFCSAKFHVAGRNELLGVISNTVSKLTS